MRVLTAGPDPDLFMSTTADDREPGLHLSDITKLMNYERDRKLNPNTPIDLMTLERGHTWETMVARALSERHQRPGYRPKQILEDGIWLSPDWVNEDADVQAEEWKATKKSRRQGFENIAWSWMPNVMSYLRALLRRGIARVPIVRFRLWWVNGDYSREQKTCDFDLLNDYERIDVEFTERELDENWRRILTFAERKGLLCPSRKTTTPAPRRRDSSEPPTSRSRAASTRRRTKPSPRRRAAS